MTPLPNFPSKTHRSSSPPRKGPRKPPHSVRKATFGVWTSIYTPKGKNGWNRLKTGLRRSFKDLNQPQTAVALGCQGTISSPHPLTALQRREAALRELKASNFLIGSSLLPLSPGGSSPTVPFSSFPPETPYILYLLYTLFPNPQAPNTHLLSALSPLFW